MRLARKVAIQTDGNFVDVILLLPNTEITCVQETFNPATKRSAFKDDTGIRTPFLRMQFFWDML
jgi:hypothetical protein